MSYSLLISVFGHDITEIIVSFENKYARGMYNLVIKELNMFIDYMKYLTNPTLQAFVVIVRRNCRGGRYGMVNFLYPHIFSFRQVLCRICGWQMQEAFIQRHPSVRIIADSHREFSLPSFYNHPLYNCSRIITDSHREFSLLSLYNHPLYNRSLSLQPT